MPQAQHSALGTFVIPGMASGNGGLSFSINFGAGGSGGGAEGTPGAGFGISFGTKAEGSVGKRWIQQYQPRLPS